MRCGRVAVCAMVIAVLSTINIVSIQAMDRKMSSKIIVNLPSRTLEYYENNQLIKEYPVAIGKPSTPTPLGLYSIMDKEVNPCWYPPERDGYVVSSGPDNPLGYRWMGFWGNYGIHGTNAPWSIGSVISNGCIRMHEEDVEELFPQIECDTPVEITYDQIKLRVDGTGKASIGIYPDVYEYGKITLEQVKDKLMTDGLDSLVDDDFLIQLINEEKGEQVLFAELCNLKINKTTSPYHLLGWDDVLFSPVSSLSANLGTNMGRNDKQHFLIGKRHILPGMVNYNILYRRSNYLPTLLDVKQSWDEYKYGLKINAPQLLLAGQTIIHQRPQINDRNNVPIFQVAKALGKKLYWEEQSKTLWLGSTDISVTMLSEEPYLEESKRNDGFNASARWDETQNNSI